MKKKIGMLAVFILLIFTLFSVTASAEGLGESDYFDRFVESIPEGSVDIESEEDVLSDVGIDALFSRLGEALSSNFGDALSLFALLLGISALMAVCDALGGQGAGTLSGSASAATSVVFAVIIFMRIYPAVLTVRESLEELSLFFEGLIPVLTGILTAGGHVNTAATHAFNMNITFALVSELATSLLLPLAFSLFALSLLSGFDGGGVSVLSKNIKGIFMWLLGIAGAIIIGAVSMQSVIAGAQDSAYLRAAKYAASGMIPVVGSTVSSALATLAGGLSYVKSTVGVSAVLVIITLSLAPLIQLLLFRLAFSLSVSLLEFCGSVGGVRVFSAFRSALDALISVYAVSAVVYIAEIVVFMKCGVSVFG
jgi:stage III sporulation protein AE